jgi:hypothetical protein
MFCKERERLIDIHLAAVARNAAAAPAIAKLKDETWNQAWWNAIQEARERRHQALANLNRHQSEHGC